MRKQKTEYYLSRARKEGFRSRSAYKLLEILQEFDFVKPYHNIVDIGSAPGGWVSILKRYSKGHIIAVDLRNMAPIKGVNYIQGDFNDKLVRDEILESIPAKAHLITSDLTDDAEDIAAKWDEQGKTTLKLLGFLPELLRSGGFGIFKFTRFHNANNNYSKIYKTLFENFIKVTIKKPRASFSHSPELYAVCINYNPKKINRSIRIIQRKKPSLISRIRIWETHSWFGRLFR